MKAVVLVGGEGTRLRPLTLSVPKQMLPIVGVAMIERVLGHLGAHGIDEAVLSLGYLPHAFLEAYPDGRAAGVALTYAVEPEPLDTAGAVRFAADHAGVDDTFVVVNGDVLTDLDLGRLIAFHRSHGAEGTIALYPVSDPSSFGVVPTDDDGRVIAFVEKPPRDEAPTNLINAGTYILEPSVLSRVPQGRRVSIERETFPAMVRDGGLFAAADDAYWLDTGTPAAYLQANLDLVEGRRGYPPSPGSVRLGRQVPLGAGGVTLTSPDHDAHGTNDTNPASSLDAAALDPSAPSAADVPSVWVSGSPAIEGEVRGACWIGDGAVVASGAVVERSIIGPGCVIEPGAAVIGSVLLEGARVAARSSVSGSVLGPQSTVGERCDLRPVSVLGAAAVVASGSLVDGERVPG